MKRVNLACKLVQPDIHDVESSSLVCRFSVASVDHDIVVVKRSRGQDPHVS